MREKDQVWRTKKRGRNDKSLRLTRTTGDKTSFPRRISTVSKSFQRLSVHKRRFLYAALNITKVSDILFVLFLVAESLRSVQEETAVRVTVVYSDTTFFWHESSHASPPPPTSNLLLALKFKSLCVLDVQVRT